MEKNVESLSVAGGANRDRYWRGCCIRRTQHVAAAIKNSARIYDHAWGMDLAGDYAFGLNLHASLGKNDAVKAASDDHVIPFNLSFDLGALSEDYRLLRMILPFTFPSIRNVPFSCSVPSMVTP